MRISVVLSLLLTAISLGGSLAFAEAPPENPVLEAYDADHGEYPLTNARVSSEGRLIVNLGEGTNRALNPAMRHSTESEWIGKACTDWMRAIQKANTAADPSVMMITSQGGSLWECGPKIPTLIEEWDDYQTPSTTVNQVGNTYISIAGQASFATVRTYGINFAEGVTLYKHRLDFAFTTSFVNTNTTLSMGLLFRYRIPIVPAFGMNFGVQPLFVMSLISAPAGSTDPSTLATSFSLAGVGGFNFNVPTGTIDLSGSYSTNGAYTTLLGHTFFFNVR